MCTQQELRTTIQLTLSKCKTYFLAKCYKKIHLTFVKLMSDTTPIKTKIQQILTHISKGIYEKEEVIALALLSAVAGESIFLLGPPGVAKSLIARRLKFAFKDGKSFEYLMNKFSTPDEIFGPISIKKLKDEDKYERLTNRYMPDANVVFLDEIWKASSSIQNALLTILNEKIYRNGDTDMEVNIKGIIAASNELPTADEGLEALWDRFLIRYALTEIKQGFNFINMILNTDDVYKDNLPDNIKITNDELNAWEMAINAIEVPAEVVNTLQMIKLRIEEHDQKSEFPFKLYDRRWKKIVKLLRTAAFLNDRNKVDLMDCFLITHCLWGNPQQIQAAKEIVSDTVRLHGYTLAVNLTNLKKEIEAFDDEVKSETMIPNKIVVEELYLIDRQYYEVLNIDNYFEGKYIKSSEFEKLKIDDAQTVGIYDENSKLTYKVKAQRAKIENNIEIQYNAQTIILPIKTHKAEKINYLYRKPHSLVQRHWDSKMTTLEQYVQQQKEKLQNEKPNEVLHLRTNLFVDSQLAEIVETNLREVTKSLQSLSLNLEKIKHYYQTL
jgi:MoxR-like ATPase